MSVTGQHWHAVFAQRLPAMHAAVAVVGRWRRVLYKPMDGAVIEGQPLGFMSGHLAKMLADTGPLIEVRAPVGGIPFRPIFRIYARAVSSVRCS